MGVWRSTNTGPAPPSCSLTSVLGWVCTKATHLAQDLVGLRQGRSWVCKPQPGQEEGLTGSGGGGQGGGGRSLKSRQNQSTGSEAADYAG